MIDISKILAGDIVHFRNGGKSVVVHKTGSFDEDFYIDGMALANWLDNGVYSEIEGKETGFDIVKVEPKKVEQKHFRISVNGTEARVLQNWQNGSGTIYKITIRDDGKHSIEEK